MNLTLPFVKAPMGVLKISCPYWLSFIYQLVISTIGPIKTIALAHFPPPLPTSFHIISWFKSSCEAAPAHRALALSLVCSHYLSVISGLHWRLGCNLLPWEGGVGGFLHRGSGPIHLPSSLIHGGCGLGPAGPR